MWKENILSTILFVSWSVSFARLQNILHLSFTFKYHIIRHSIIWIFSVTNAEIFWNKFRHQSIPMTISHIYVRFNDSISCRIFLNLQKASLWGKATESWKRKRGLDLLRFFRLSSQYKFPAIFSIICPFASVLPLFSHQKYTPTFFPILLYKLQAISLKFLPEFNMVILCIHIWRLSSILLQGFL